MCSSFEGWIELHGQSLAPAVEAGPCFSKAGSESPKKKAAFEAAFFERFGRWARLEAHAAMSMSAGRRRRRFLGQFRNHGFRRYQKRGDGGGILQRGAHDLGRVD